MQDVIVSKSCHVQNDTSKSSAIFCSCCCVSLGATKGISREIEKMIQHMETVESPVALHEIVETFCCMFALHESVQAFCCLLL